MGEEEEQEKAKGEEKAEDVKEIDEDDEDDEDDGINLVLHDVSEMEKHLEEGKALPELVAAEKEATKSSTEPAEKEESAEKEPKKAEEDGDEDEEDTKFKYSHGKGKKQLKLPGRAGQINESNYPQFAAELGKKNTPFEVDLDRMAEKPWTRFNSSLDDYFNFGFNEQTWREYAARQVALRIHQLDEEREKARVAK